jgi:hypothetical protein
MAIPSGRLGSRVGLFAAGGNGWRLLPAGSGYAGNAGMMSSVRDLLLWANNFADARVGTPALLASMQTATVLTGGQTTPHGMGLGTGSYRGRGRSARREGDFGTATSSFSIPTRSSPSRCCATWIRPGWAGWQLSIRTI